MSDLIDRQAAIDAIENAFDRETILNRFVRKIAISAVRLLPSAQPETPSYVAEIESEYKKWLSMPHINKPLAKALYEVWKKHDREDTERSEQ